MDGPGTTLVGMLERAALDPVAGLRFVDRRESETFLSWAAVRDGAYEVAAGLAARGLEGQRIALIHPTGPDFFFAFFGALLAGAVPVPLYPPVRLGRLDDYHARSAALLRAVSAGLVIADGTVRGLLGRTIEQARSPAGCSTVAELRRNPTGFRPRTPRIDDLALVQFSSGTTVEPKPVALSHRAIVAQLEGLRDFFPSHGEGPDGRPTGVSWLPLYHDMGLIGCVFSALAFPSVLTLLGPELFVAKPALWLRALSRHRATISVAPNFAFALAVERIADDELDGVDLSAWRLALNGAEPVQPAVLRRFQERFARWGFRPEALTPVYGLSEATLALTFSAPDRPFRSVRFEREALAAGRAEPAEKGVELVSVGRPLAGTTIEVRDPEGRPCAEGRVGRIWARGPGLMDGYFERPAASAAALVEGWLDTGDLGFRHDGELFLTGRAKDILILRGRNHAPAELEQALDTVAGVRKGCAVAIGHLPEGAATEELWLFVETREKPAGLEAACRDAVLGATGLKVDRLILLPPGTLPRTSSGKLRRGETLRLFLAGELRPPARVTPLLLGKEWLLSRWALRRASRDA